jgi:hypothetical protein
MLESGLLNDSIADLQEFELDRGSSEILTSSPRRVLQVLNWDSIIDRNKDASGDSV